MKRGRDFSTRLTHSRLVNYRIGHAGHAPDAIGDQARETGRKLSNASILITLHNPPLIGSPPPLKPVRRAWSARNTPLWCSASGFRPFGITRHLHVPARLPERVPCRCLLDHESQKRCTKHFDRFFIVAPGRRSSIWNHSSPPRTSPLGPERVPCRCLLDHESQARSNKS